MDYLSEDRVEMRYTLPLAEIVFDFFDQLKSRTRATPPWTTNPTGSRSANLVKVDILLQGETGRRVQRHRTPGQGVRVRGG
jgi:GTP-binding protein LepA